MADCCHLENQRLTLSLPYFAKSLVIFHPVTHVGPPEPSADNILNSKHFKMVQGCCLANLNLQYPSIYAT